MVCMGKAKKHPWGAALRKLRKGKGRELTQEKLCELLDLPLTTLRNWEQGRVAPPVYVRHLVETFLRGYRG